MGSCRQSRSALSWMFRIVYKRSLHRILVRVILCGRGHTNLSRRNSMINHARRQQHSPWAVCSKVHGATTLRKQEKMCATVSYGLSMKRLERRITGLIIQCTCPEQAWSVLLQDKEYGV